MSVLTEYIQAALKQAKCDTLEDGQFFCTIPFLKGPYGAGPSRREAVAELRDVLEEWLVGPSETTRNYRRSQASL